MDDRRKWELGRAKYIGSSDTPSLLGIGYAGSSPVSVYADKTGAAPRKIDDATQLSFDRGHIYEAAIVADFGLTMGREVTHVNPPQTWFHAEYPFIGASVDAHSGDEVVEAKFVTHDWEEWLDGPPVKHVAQVQHQLACTGWERGWLVGRVGRELQIHEIERDEEFIRDLVELIVAFWHRYIVPRKMPPVDATEATSKALARIYPADKGTVVELESEVDGLLSRLKQVKESLKHFEAEKTEIENRLKAEIGDSTYAVTPRGRAVSWKLTQRRGYEVPPGQYRQVKVLDRLPKSAMSLPVVRRDEEEEMETTGDE